MGLTVPGGLSFLALVLCLTSLHIVSFSINERYALGWFCNNVFGNFPLFFPFIERSRDMLG